MTRIRVNYLAHRLPSIARTQWAARWREHWWLAASLPASEAICRYSQCEVLWDRDSPPHDGAASAEFVSAEARLGLQADPDFYPMMRADEEQVFDRPIRDCSFVADHEVVHGSEDGPFKVMRYLRRRAGSGLDAVWREGYAEDLLRALPALTGYARNRTMEPREDSQGERSIDGLDELWFQTQADAMAAVASPAIVALDRAVERDIEVVHEVVTNEVLLKSTTPRPADRGTA